MAHDWPSQSRGPALQDVLSHSLLPGDEIQVKMNPPGISSCWQYLSYCLCASPLSALPICQQHLPGITHLLAAQCWSAHNLCPAPW